MIKNKIAKFHFTIVEVSVAMLVLAVLLTIVMQFFDTAQKGWSASSGKSTIYENARIALGLINRQVQGIYYKDGVVPFYHKGSDYNPIDEYSNDSLSFVSYLDEAPNPYCTSTACELQYQLYYNEDNDVVQDTAGWMLLSITGNKLDNGGVNNEWNFYNSNSATAFSTDNSSRNNYIKLIPYVTELDFTCYNSAGKIIRGDESDSQVLPTSIEVTLSLMGRTSWNKWIEIGGNGNINNDIIDDNENAAAETFRKKHEQTFKRTIYIGNRN